MGIFDSIMGAFSPKDTQQQNTNSTQSGTGSSQGNIWNDPRFQGFFNSYGNTNWFNPQFNQNQTQAASSQLGAGNNLQQGFQAAGNIAQGGITPGSIAQFQSPYTQQVVNATQDQFNKQNSIQNSQNSAYAAKQGALTGTGAGNLRAQTQMAQQTAQAPVIAGLYNQGFNNAANLAGQSAGLQLQGAGQLGNLTGALTGANTAGFGMGSSLFNSPYQLASQGAAGLSPFIGAAGTNNQFSGQSAGTMSGTTTHQPSPFDVFGGMAGFGLGMFSGGGSVDGGPPSPGDNPGMDRMMGSLAPTVKALRHAASGGSVRGYEDGGDVGLGSWLPTVTTGAPEPTFASKLGAGINGFRSSLNPQQPAQSRGSQPQSSPLGSSMSSLADSLRSMMQQRPGYADGGAPAGGGPPSDDPYWEVMKRRSLAAPPLPAAETPESGGFLSRLTSAIPRPFSSGVWTGQPMTPMQRGATALMSAGSDRAPFKGAGNYMATQSQRDIDNAMASRKADLEAARMIGTLGGKPTMEARQLQQAGDIATGAVNGKPTIAAQQYGLEAAKNPAQVKALEAHSAEEQIRVKAVEQQNALHAQRLKSIDDMEIVDPNPAANALVYRQMRANAEAAHQMALTRLQNPSKPAAGAPAPGVRTWSPSLPDGGL